LHNIGREDGVLLCNVDTAGLLKYGKMASEEVNRHHKCVNCGRQFIDVYSPPKGYSNEVKKECLRLYLDGMGFRAIERNKGVHHT